MNLPTSFGNCGAHHLRLLALQFIQSPFCDTLVGDSHRAIRKHTVTRIRDHLLKTANEGLLVAGAKSLLAENASNRLDAALKHPALNCPATVLSPNIALQL